MGRRLPRAFFWIDQRLIRSGTWLKLSAEARLAYIALSASCDRHGISIWSRGKLMELSSCQDPDEWRGRLVELESHRLIEAISEHCPPAIQVLELSQEECPSPNTAPAATSVPSWASAAAANPIIVHTQTTIHLGGKAAHAKSGDSD